MGVSTALTEVKVRKATPGDKPYRLADQRGLYLQVQPNGSKYWRYKYRFRQHGRLREKLMALGTYPVLGICAFDSGFSLRLR